MKIKHFIQLVIIASLTKPSYFTHPLPPLKFYCKDFHRKSTWSDLQSGVCLRFELVFVLVRLIEWMKEVFLLVNLGAKRDYE